MSLSIVSQQSLFNEKKYISGNPVVLCHVVKNGLFAISLKLEKVAYNFLTGKFEFELLLAPAHDGETLSQLSSHITRPFNITAHPNSRDSSQCRLDCRLAVLSSKYDHRPFVLCIRFAQPGTGEFVEARTNAIYTCSKFIQIEQKRRACGKSNTSDEEESDVKRKTTKRVRADDLLQQLADIKAIQIKQTCLLEAVVRKTSHLDEPVTLEGALSSLLNTCQEVPPLERPTKIRRLLASLPPPMQTLADDVGSFLMQRSGTEELPEPWMSGDIDAFYSHC